jgi:ABC-2 type transport system permease protein
LQQARAIDAVAPEDEQAFVDGLLDDVMQAAQRPPVVTKVNWGEGVEIEEPTSLTMATNTEQASAGQLVTWVQITLLGAAQVLVDERLLGTLRRMFVMPTARTSILSGKLVARLLLGLAQMGILLVGGALLFGVEWGSNPLAVAVVSLAFALATVGLGILLATIVRTRGQAQSVVIGVSMALAALGGAWYPIEITPPVYRQVVQVLPSTWAMRAYTDLLARGADVMGVLPEVGMLLLFAVVFTTVGLVRFQRYS